MGQYLAGPRCVTGGFINVHALPCDAAACAESWNKQQDTWFFPARIHAQDAGFLWQTHNVWAKSSERKDQHLHEKYRIAGFT